MKHFRMTLLMLAVLLTTTCADELEMHVPCIRQSDCPDGQQCILGSCMAVPDFEVDVEVFPPATSGYLQQPLRSIDLTSPDAFEIVVPPPTLVRGVLHMNKKPFEGSARVAFSATDPGLRRSSLRFTTEVDPDTEEQSSFAVELVGSFSRGGLDEAITYSVTATPLEALDCCAEDTTSCAVPLSISGMRFSTDTEDLVLSFTSTPTLIEGRVFDSAEGEPLLPSASTKVEALHEQGAHSLPTVADEEGHFCLALDLPDPGHETSVRLRMAPRPEHPSFIVEQDVDVVSGEAHHGIEVHLPSYGEFEKVTGRLIDRDDEPIEGARITFEGEVTLGGEFRTETWTNEDGTFEVELMRGVYDARAVPPESSLAARVDITGLKVDPGSDDWPMTPFAEPAPRRHLLSGVVVKPSSERKPIPDVEVIAEMTPAVQNNGAKITRFTTKTDEDGRFLLALDTGAYRLHFRPAWTTGLPWVIGPLEFVEVGSERDVGVVVMEEASVLDGRALGQKEGGTTTPLEGARVQVHARRMDKTFFLWEGRAGEDGTFQVALPRSLAGKVETAAPEEEPANDFW